MPNKAKRFAAKTAIKLCVVGAVIATVAAADKAQHHVDQKDAGKKWMVQH